MLSLSGSLLKLMKEKHVRKTSSMEIMVSCAVQVRCRKKGMDKEGMRVMRIILFISVFFIKVDKGETKKEHEGKGLRSCWAVPQCWERKGINKKDMRVRG